MTENQIEGIKDYLNEHLLPIFQDAYDRTEFIENIIDDVVEDIEDCADWSEFEDDEICWGDIDIALARILLIMSGSN